MSFSLSFCSCIDLIKVVNDISEHILARQSAGKNQMTVSYAERIPVTR